MKQFPFFRASFRQRGIAAVELAIILPILIALLAVPFYFGRVFWHYTVAEKAAHDVALYPTPSGWSYKCAFSMIS